MAKWQKEWSVSHEREFHYRFTCEHCGKTTDWKADKIKRGYSLKTSDHVHNLTADQQTRMQQLARAALDKAYSELKMAAHKGDYAAMRGIVGTDMYDGVAHLSSYCPYCRKMQSWEMGSFKKWIFGAWALAGFALSFLLTCIAHYAANAENPVQRSAGEFFDTLPFLPVFIGVGVGLLVGVIHYFIKHKSFGGTVNSKPEFKWESGYSPVRQPQMPKIMPKVERPSYIATIETNEENAPVSRDDDANKLHKKSRNLALFLAIFPWTGFLGIDRFYLGYIGIGIIKFLTAGGLLVLYVVDIVKIARGTMRDKKGNRLV